MTKEIITQDYVKQMFEYRDGELYWKVSVGRVKAGQKTGNLNQSGYFALGLNKKYCLVHRIIFLMHYGYLPKYLDHIDGNRVNNRIENLRAATFSQNQQNKKLSKKNTSGVKGVSWHKATNKWEVQFSVNKKHKYFGLYEDLELASLVAQEARDKYHGAFANHG